MSVVVPDASVILKWVIPDPTGEDDLGAALRLRDAAIAGKIRILVPTLWLYETANTLTRRFPEHAADALRLLIEFDMDAGDWTRPWLDRAVALTRRYGVTFYDAAYHALALVNKGVFVTADRKYALKAGQAGGVTALREWRT